MKNDLPSYSAVLDAYHRAFSAELQQMVAELPLCSGDRVLDIGCGDGIYSRWLAPHVQPGGEVIGVDRSPAYLRRAGRLNRGVAGVRFVNGDITNLPFKDHYFDAAWCAQNLFSFPDPETAVRELTRVVRPGGIVAIFENDSLHQVLLPWPVDAELALARAEFKSFQRKTVLSKKFYVARGLRRLLHRAGLKPQRKRIYAHQREAPLAAAESEFLRLYLAGLWKRTRPYLTSAARQRIAPLMQAQSPRFLLKQEDLTLTCLDHVVWGKKAAA